MADSIDLTRISKGDHRVKLSRVFRDPSINTHGANNPKFEIWIAFEYENNHLVNAEVLKSNGIGRPLDRAQITGIDIKIAMAAAKDLPVHQTETEDRYRFDDYGRDKFFTVEGSELFPKLEAQLKKVQPSKRSEINGKSERKPTVPEKSSTNKTPSASKRADVLIGKIDLILGESLSLIRDYRTTNPD
ncbi:MAG TPA: hypothetical protein PLT55_00500 [Acidimicrobiia bacterium]|nr:hypothetical protein [Acidimicrobiia bacterium]